MLLTAPQHVTVDTNAETSGRLHETHDAFAHQNCAENRCIWLAMVSSVSPETEHTPAKVLTVSRESPAAPVSDSSAAGLRDDGPSNTSAHQSPQVWRAPEGPEGQPAAPVGGGGAWPGNIQNLDRLEAAARPAGPDRASSRRAEPHISDQAPPVWRAPEGPEGTGGLRDRPLRAKLACGDLAGGRARRRPEHQRRNKQHSTRHRNTTPGIQKPTSESDVGLWWS